MNQNVTESGATHSYLTEERICFAKLVNEMLRNDEEVKDIIPINPENDDMFHCLEDGIILCKMIN